MVASPPRFSVLHYFRKNCNESLIAREFLERIRNTPKTSFTNVFGIRYQILNYYTYYTFQISRTNISSNLTYSILAQII